MRLTGGLWPWLWLWPLCVCLCQCCLKRLPAIFLYCIRQALSQQQVSCKSKNNKLMFSSVLIPPLIYVYTSSKDFIAGYCRAIKQGMVKVNTWVFILRRYKWHIHAGSWSLVNCLAGSPYKALYKVLMNINECGCRPPGWPRP